MTTTVTEATTSALRLTGYDGLSTSIGLAIVAVLALLLLLRELVPRLRDGDTSRETHALDVAIMPLLIAFVVIVATRLAELVR